MPLAAAIGFTAMHLDCSTARVSGRRALALLASWVRYSRHKVLRAAWSAGLKRGGLNNLWWCCGVRSLSTPDVHVEPDMLYSPTPVASRSFLHLASSSPSSGSSSTARDAAQGHDARHTEWWHNHVCMSTFLQKAC